MTKVGITKPKEVFPLIFVTVISTLEYVPADNVSNVISLFPTTAIVVVYVKLLYPMVPAIFEWNVKEGVWLLVKVGILVISVKVGRNEIVLILDSIKP